MSNLFLNNKKHVRFNSNVEMRLMYVWSFAYKQARKGQWETIARDFSRFNRRIVAADLEISKVLEMAHRDTIYNTRFANI